MDLVKPLVCSNDLIISLASLVKSTASAISSVFPILSVNRSALTASPTPVTIGIKSIASPTTPAHALGSYGLAATSAILNPKETTSNTVSQTAPVPSFLPTGLLSQ